MIDQIHASGALPAVKVFPVFHLLEGWMGLRSVLGAVAKRIVPVSAGTRTPCPIRSLAFIDRDIAIFIRVVEVMSSEIVVWSEKGESVW
jgi:hypothetical protein